LSLPAFADAFSLLELCRLSVGDRSVIDIKIFNKKGFKCWTFLANEACFHLSGYINSQKTEYALHKNPLISSIVSKNNWVSLYFEETITAENYPNLFTQFIDMLGQNK
jgi:hypothetical protein